MDGHLFNPDDGKQPETFSLNIKIFFFNLLALYIEYISKEIPTFLITSTKNRKCMHFDRYEQCDLRSFIKWSITDLTASVTSIQIGISQLYCLA